MSRSLPVSALRAVCLFRCCPLLVRLRVFFISIQTCFFPETYALRDRLEARYGVHFERRATSLSLSESSCSIWGAVVESQPDLCCRLRKVEAAKRNAEGTTRLGYSYSP